jgi:hypothetical protein
LPAAGGQKKRRKEKKKIHVRAGLPRKGDPARIFLAPPFLRIFTGPLPVILSPFLPVPGMPVLPGSVQKGRKGVFFLHI